MRKFYYIFGYKKPYPDYPSDGDNKAWKLLSKRKVRRTLKQKLRQQMFLSLTR